MLEKVLPPIIIFLVGYLLKRLKILDKSAGDFMLKIVFYLAAPALIFLSVPGINFSPETIFLPLAAIVISLVTLIFGYLFTKPLKLPPQKLSVLLSGIAIMNNGFVLPFLLAFYGQAAYVKLIIFDVGNLIFQFTVVYALAANYGKGSFDKKYIASKILGCVPLWAVVIAFFMKLNHISFAPVITQTLTLLSALVVPLVMLSLGTYFVPKISDLRNEIVGVFLRMGLGLLVGLVLIWLLRLKGLDMLVVLLGAAAPVAFNTVTFANMENLDVEFASTMISLSMIVGLILTPLLLILVKI